MKRQWVLYAVVILSALGAYLAGAGSAPLWDRDEGWYAQTSRQMLHDGNWITPRFLDQPRYEKPPLVYWTQALCMKAFGPSVLTARIPSAIAMTCCVALLGLFIGKTIGFKRGLLTALVFCSSAMVIVSGKMCLTDATLILFLTLAQIALYQILVSKPETKFRLLSSVHLFWIALAFTILVKGPVALVILMASAAIYSLFSIRTEGFKASFGWIGKIRLIRGAIILGLFVIPWLAWVFLKDRLFFQNMLMEPFRHASASQEGHWTGPGYHIGVIWITFFPWSLFLPIAIWGGWKNRRLPPVRFALSTFIAVLILAESMATKLPHYMLPAFGSLAFLSADAIVRIQRKNTLARLRIPFLIACGIWLLLGLGLMSVIWLPIRYFRPGFPIWGAISFTLVGVAFLASSACCFYWNKWKLAPWCVGLGMLGVISTAFIAYIPNAQFLNLSRNLGQWINNNASEKDTVSIIRYGQPTVSFYQNCAEFKQVSLKSLAENAPAAWADYIIIPKDIYEEFLKEYPGKAPFLEKKAEFRGLNYNAAAQSNIYSKMGPELGPDYPSASSPLMVQDVLILKKVEPVQ